MAKRVQTSVFALLLGVLPLTDGGTAAAGMLVRFNADGTGTGFDVSAYDAGSQDEGSYEVHDGTGTDTTDGSVVTTGDGPTLKLSGNAWKKIELPTFLQTVGEDYVLRFEFKSTDGGEIQGILFETNNALDGGEPDRAFIPLGSQPWGNTSWPGYHSYAVGDGWTGYQANVGEYVTGTGYRYLVFTGDEDQSGQTQTAYFRNLSLAIPEPASLIVVSLGGLLCIIRRRR